MSALTPDPTPTEQIASLRAQCDFLQRVCNVVDGAHDDETVRQLRRRISMVAVVKGGKHNVGRRSIRSLGIEL